MAKDAERMAKLRQQVNMLKMQVAERDERLRKQSERNVSPVPESEPEVTSEFVFQSARAVRNAEERLKEAERALAHKESLLQKARARASQLQQLLDERVLKVSSQLLSVVACLLLPSRRHFHLIDPFFLWFLFVVEQQVGSGK